MIKIVKRTTDRNSKGTTLKRILTNAVSYPFHCFFFLFYYNSPLLTRLTHEQKLSNNIGW